MLITLVGDSASVKSDNGFAKTYLYRHLLNACGKWHSQNSNITKYDKIIITQLSNIA